MSWEQSWVRNETLQAWRSQCCKGANIPFHCWDVSHYLQLCWALVVQYLSLHVDCFMPQVLAGWCWLTPTFWTMAHCIVMTSHVQPLCFMIDHDWPLSTTMTRHRPSAILRHYWGYWWVLLISESYLHSLIVMNHGMGNHLWAQNHIYSHKATYIFFASLLVQ